MKGVRGLRGTGTTRIDQPHETTETQAAEGINPAARQVVGRVKTLEPRGELFEPLEPPGDPAAEEELQALEAPVRVARTTALAAVRSPADRNLEALRGADIAGLIDRLSALSNERAAQLDPAVDVLKRIKRLMDFIERRRQAARPQAGRSRQLIQSGSRAASEKDRS
jgi:hypothetical protein